MVKFTIMFTSTLNEGAFVVGKPFIARRINKV